MGKVLPPGVRGLDCFPGTRGVFVAGQSDINSVSPALTSGSYGLAVCIPRD